MPSPPSVCPHALNVDSLAAAVTRHRRTLPSLALAAAALSAACSKTSTNVIEATGTIEIVEVDVAPAVPARVQRVLVDEGAAVRVGDTVAILSTATLHANLDEVDARARSAEATLAEITKGSRPEEVRRAEADLAAAQSEVTRTADDLTRISALAAQQNVSAQQLDAAQAASRSAIARRDGTQSALTLLREGSRPERVAQARAEAERARAAAAAVHATAKDLVLLAPVNGVVTSRNAEPGEMLAVGQAALTLGETKKPWVRVYVNQGALARIVTGAAVVGHLDDYPSVDFGGKVLTVATKAEFTPRVALTEKERADLLFGVKVEFADTTGTLKAGLPITVRITPRTVAPAP